MYKLRTQLFLTMTLVVLFCIAMTSFLFRPLLNREFEKYIAGQQKRKAEDIVSTLNTQYNPSTKQWNTEYIHGIGMYALLDGYIVKVYDVQGNAVWDAENHNMAMCAQIMQEIAKRMERRRPKVAIEFVSEDYELRQNERHIGGVEITYYGPYFLRDSDFYFLEALQLALLFVGGISLLFSLLVSGMLARRVANPISKTADVANQIAKGNYEVRFEGKTKSKELDDLTGAVNQLAEGLAEQENLRKRLMMDVAHELRTPLTTLGAHLEAMVEGVWEPTVQRLQGCHEETERLSVLVKDIERLAKVESDALVLDKTCIDLMDAACMGCEHVVMEAERKKITLHIEGKALWIDADQDRVHQVIWNLLSNAVKYTPENGNIYVSVQEDGGCAKLTVADDGIGIAQEDIPFLFERFYRADKSRSRQTGGTGIGLAIVKSIMLAHGGTVEVKSIKGEGSRFQVVFPKES